MTQWDITADLDQLLASVKQGEGPHSMADMMRGLLWSSEADATTLLGFQRWLDDNADARAAPGIGQQLLSDVRRRLTARDDCAFVAEGPLFGCVGRGAFGAVEQVWQRIASVLEIGPVAVALIGSVG